MKKICFVKYDMQDASGGARVCANLANALQDSCEVHVVSICSQKETTFYPLDENVKYNILIKGTGRIRETLVKGVPLLRKYLKDHKIDLAFAVGVSMNPFVVPATKGISCKAIACEHLNCLNEYDNSKSQRFCRFLGARFADKIVTLTQKDRDAYIKKYRLNPKKVEYVYNWMDEALLESETEYNENAKKILTVVRIEPVKGIENIIQASKQLKVNFPDWQWHIFGGGDEEYVQKLQTEIDRSGLSDFLILKGKVNDIYERYAEYGLFVLTSYCEGLPMVLIEAKAKKLPIISYDCLTGPSDIVRDRVDGFLVPVGNREILYDVLDKCMSDKVLRKKLSDHAHGNIETFHKDKILKKWEELIYSQS